MTYKMRLRACKVGHDELNGYSSEINKYVI